MINRKILRKIGIFLFLANVTFFASLLVFPYGESFNLLGFLAKERLLQQPYLVFIITPLLFLVSTYICRRFSPEMSAGNLNNFDEAVSSLNKHPKNFRKIEKNFGLKTIWVTYFSSLISTFAGGALGREATSVQMSSSLFSSMAHRFRPFLPKINLESWLFIGGGVGLTLAFNAPFSGFFYVVERFFQKERFAIFKSKQLLKVFVVTAIVCLICEIILAKIEDVFKINPLHFFYNSKQLYFIIFVALSCSFIIYFLKRISSFFFEKFAKSKSKLWFLTPIICGLLVAITSWICGIYSFSGGILTIHEALLSHHQILTFKDFFGRVLNTIFSVISGNAGGVVAPSMAIGTSFGSFVGSFAGEIDSKTLMLVGIAASLAIILKRPFVGALLTLEITSQPLYNMPFLVLASFTSYFFFLYFLKDLVIRKN